MSEAAPAAPATQAATPPPAAVAPPVSTAPPAAADAVVAAKRAQEAEQIRLRGVAIRKQREEERAKLTGEVTALKAEREGFAKKAADADAWRKRLLEDPENLKDVYGDKWYEALTRAKLGDDSNLQVKALRDELRAELAAVREREAAREKTEHEAVEARGAAEKQTEQQAFADLADEIKATMEAKKDTYTTAATLGLHAEAAKRCRAAYEAGKPLDPDAAIAEVEAELDKLVESVLATPKWAKKYRSAQEVLKPKAEEGQRWETQRPVRSIGTDMTPGPAEKPAGRLTPQQKREKAIRLLEGLKSE